MTPSKNAADQPRRRWRFRISTLMLLVVIAALASTLIVERVRKYRAEQRLATVLEHEVRLAQQVQSLRQAQQAGVPALKVRSQASAPAGKGAAEAKGSVPNRTR